MGTIWVQQLSEACLLTSKILYFNIWCTTTNHILYGTIGYPACLWMFYHLWLDIGKPTELSHLAYSILLVQLIATLIHYPCTVALTGLADRSAFLELVLPTMWSHIWDNGAHGEHQIGGIGLMFTTVLVTRLLGHPGLSGLTSTSWKYGTSKWSCWNQDSR